MPESPDASNNAKLAAFSNPPGHSMIAVQHLNNPCPQRNG